MSPNYTLFADEGAVATCAHIENSWVVRVNGEATDVQVRQAFVDFAPSLPTIATFEHTFSDTIVVIRVVSCPCVENVGVSWVDDDGADEMIIQNALPSLASINAFEDPANIKPLGCVIVKLPRRNIKRGKVFRISGQMLDVGENRFGVKATPVFASVPCFVDARTRFRRSCTCDDDMAGISRVEQNPPRLFRCFLRQVAIYASPTHPVVP